MKIEKFKPSEIKLNPNNPRIIKDDKFKKLVTSLVEFPEMADIRPIVLNSDHIIIGGNMRFRAMLEAGWKSIPVIVTNLSPEKQKEFIIKDNVSGGEWDWDALASEWNADLLSDWGLDVPGFDVNSDEFGTDFSLPDGDKSPFQQMTFTLADEQATIIQNAIFEIKQTDDFKYCETMGNENSNGNALYLIVRQWEEQKK